MKIVWTIVVMTLLIVSCTPYSEVVATQLYSTLTAIPTSTPYPTKRPYPTSTPYPSPYPTNTPFKYLMVTPDLEREFIFWSNDQVIQTLKKAGLSVGYTTTENQETSKYPTLIPNELSKFYISSWLTADGEFIECYGYISSYLSYSDLYIDISYINALRRSINQPPTRLFIKDNIVLDICDSLPEEEVNKYEAALMNMD
jgi:hypothetical protein